MGSRTMGRLTCVVRPVYSPVSGRRVKRLARVAPQQCYREIAEVGHPAEARIVCNEGYQRVNGQDISTPYCNDNYLAEIARSYGFKVTNAAVRNSPALKDKICREIGSDIRIAPYCNTDSGPDRSW